MNFIQVEGDGIIQPILQRRSIGRTAIHSIDARLCPFAPRCHVFAQAVLSVVGRGGGCKWSPSVDESKLRVITRTAETNNPHVPAIDHSLLLKSVDCAVPKIGAKSL